MGKNVFGISVTEGTRLERARTAMADPNAGGKRDMALAYVNNQRRKFGDGVCTRGIFYNATGETLFYVDANSNFGRINYATYPDIVHNGQWGAFLHTKKPVVPSGSEAYVVYRGKYNDTDSCKQLIAWDVPWGQVRFDNHAYCEIYNDHAEIERDMVYQMMEAGGPQCANTSENGIYIVSSVEAGETPLYEAKFTLKEAA